MTKREFTEACAERLTGIYQMAAQGVIDRDYHDGGDFFSQKFVDELLEQDSDEGSRSGTKRVLGEELYAELQKFKTEK